MTSTLPLIDGFQRAHRNLRISVTDRCNIRCQYCMPAEVQFLPQQDLLTFEEITRLVEYLIPAGLERVRLTGGEPLVRQQLSKLVRMLRQLQGLGEIALTTNGVLLAAQATELRDAGLDRINISLDTVDAERFAEITRRDVLPRVLEGIAAAQAAGFERIRINAVPLPLLADEDLLQLARFAREQQLELRFIEFMPLDGDQRWDRAAVRDGRQLLELLEREFGKLTPQPGPSSQPASDYRYPDLDLCIGLINSVSQPFCQACDRMRISAEGKFRNCLFSNVDWDLKPALRAGDREEVLRLVRASITAKKWGHGSDDGRLQRPPQAMYQIGG